MLHTCNEHQYGDVASSKYSCMTVLLNCLLTPLLTPLLMPAYTQRTLTEGHSYKMLIEGVLPAHTGKSKTLCNHTQSALLTPTLRQAYAELTPRRTLQTHR